MEHGVSRVLRKLSGRGAKQKRRLIELPVVCAQTFADFKELNPLRQKYVIILTTILFRIVYLPRLIMNTYRLKCTKKELCDFFEILTEMRVSMLIFWVVIPCGPVRGYQRFGENYCLHLYIL